MSDALEVSPLSPFGVEVRADLSKPLSEGQKTRFRELFRRHHLILARGQDLGPADTVRLMAELDIGPVRNGREDIPVSNVERGAFLGTHELAWHSDLAYGPVPYKALLLYAVDVVNGTTSTRFCSGRLALDRLPAGERAKLEGLHALHALSKGLGGRSDFTGDPGTPQFVHPVIMPDPDVGPALYVHYNTTAHIVGMAPAASEALLRRLFEAIYDPDYVYEHVWNLGDVVIWSNIALQHARGALTTEGKRTLRRACVASMNSTDAFPQMDVSIYINP